MRKIIFGAAGFLVLVLFIGFVGCERVDQGHVGLRVNLSGGDKGQAKVQDASGWQVYMRGMTAIYEYPVFQQHKEYEPIAVPAKGGTVLTSHPSFNYSVNPAMVKQLFQTFRVDIKALEEGYIKNAMFIAMREATNRFSLDSILNNLSAYDAAVQEDLQKRLQPYFLVSQFTARMEPDDNLKKTIAAKAQAIQEALRIENEQKAIRAQAENDIISARRDSTVKVVNAQAEARSIAVQQEALQRSPQYVELIKAQKWDGKLPQYVLGSGTNMLMQIPR